MEFLPYLFVLLCGCIIGSFLSVVIFRVPFEKTIVTGRSQCPHCHHSLSPADLIPVLSYVLLNGKCRYCRHTVSQVYPIIELVTGFMFVVAYAVTIGSATTVTTSQMLLFGFLLVIFSLFIALFFIDYFYQLLPDKLVFTALGVTILYHLADFGVTIYERYAQLTYPETGLAQFLFTSRVFQAYAFELLRQPLSGYIAGLAIALFFFSLIVVTKGKGMGGGDVKFALVLGAVTGWPHALIALFGAFVSGAIVSLLLIAIGKKKLTNTIAFGPFLITSTVLVMLFGNQLVDLYIRYGLG